jgi:hypothetical protein
MATTNNPSDCINNEEKQCLIQDVGNLLTAGITKLEISSAAWCTFLKFAVEEYVTQIQMWLIDNQWSSLNGKDVTKNDICFALTQRSIDAELQFSYAYSKQVGLQSRGNYELKKDYIIIEEGTQVYEIPRGREINSVLWLTPSDIDHATFSSLGYGTNLNGTGVGGYSGFGYGGGLGAINGAYYIAPAYDIVLRAADFGLKNRILKSDLTYKITAGANGTRLLHLFSIPNHGNEIGIRKNLYKCKVWYHYYDTEDLTAEDKNKCLETCKDIIKFPSDVPLPKTDFCDLNEPSKVWVRKFLTAYAKEALGRARGKFKGELPFPDSNANMDYESLLAEGKEEKENLIEELKTWLEGMRSDKQLERRAGEAENLNTILSKVPSGFWVK